MPKPPEGLPTQKRGRFTANQHLSRYGEAYSPAHQIPHGPPSQVDGICISWGGINTEPRSEVETGFPLRPPKADKRNAAYFNARHGPLHAARSQASDKLDRHAREVETMWMSRRIGSSMQAVIPKRCRYRAPAGWESLESAPEVSPPCRPRWKSADRQSERAWIVPRGCGRG